MTRSEFIQHAVLTFARAGSTHEHAIDEAERLAQSLVARNTGAFSDTFNHERMALIMVEEAARSLGKPDGCDWPDLDAALARLEVTWTTPSGFLFCDSDYVDGKRLDGIFRVVFLKPAGEQE